MKGWKTWTGFAIVIVSAILKALGYHNESEILGTVGSAGIAVGIAHKIEKHKR
jgi:hypothetical protein